MALRLSLRRSNPVAYDNGYLLSKRAGLRARPASAMAVPTTSPDANLSQNAQVSKVPFIICSSIVDRSVQKEAALPNHDPPSNSQTAAIVNDQMPYMVATYVRPPPMMVKGEGCFLWDIENRRYLDFTAGIAVNALGHCDPEMAKLISQQVSHINAHSLLH